MQLFYKHFYFLCDANSSIKVMPTAQLIKSRLWGSRRRTCPPRSSILTKPVSVNPITLPKDSTPCNLGGGFRIRTKFPTENAPCSSSPSPAFLTPSFLTTSVAISLMFRTVSCILIVKLRWCCTNSWRKKFKVADCSSNISSIRGYMRWCLSIFSLVHVFFLWSMF